MGKEKIVTNELKDHVKIVHETEDCDAFFNSIDDLEKHKEKVHPNPNTFMNFNGGMFMMMRVSDDLEDEDAENSEEEEQTVEDNSESIEGEVEEESTTDSEGGVKK